MIWGDSMCDCHSQLAHALFDVKDSNGIVIHCPTQDGRGYGIATKLETEFYKLGKPGVFNINKIQMDTNTAAKFLLDENIDLRSYKYISKLLSLLGVKNAKVYTESKRKINQLEEFIPQVQSLSTQTLQRSPKHLQEHILSKHNTSEYKNN